VPVCDVNLECVFPASKLLLPDVPGTCQVIKSSLHGPCGGNVKNPRQCADGLTCQNLTLNADLGGTCLPTSANLSGLGGICGGNIACKAGLTCVNGIANNNVVYGSQLVNGVCQAASAQTSASYGAVSASTTAPATTQAYVAAITGTASVKSASQVTTSSSVYFAPSAPAYGASSVSSTTAAAASVSSTSTAGYVVPIAAVTTNQTSASVLATATGIYASNAKAASFLGASALSLLLFL